MISHKWLIEVLKEYKISDKIINLINEIITRWKINLKYGNNSVGQIQLKNGILQGDSMSPLLFTMAIDPILNKIDEILEGVDIKDIKRKKVNIKKIVYMDDLKIFINSKENSAEIDEKIIKLYSLIGMEINPQKSGIAAHKGIQIPEELNKYTRITEENKYQYLGLHLFEANEREINDEMILDKVKERLKELKLLELNNKTTIRCLNTQVIGQVRYYVGSVVFSCGCVDEIDNEIRKYLREVDYLHKGQNAHRIYLDETRLGSGLISVRDMQLITLVKLYREMKHREEEDIYKRVDNVINKKVFTHSLLNKIKIHQKYLDDCLLYDRIQDMENDEDVYQYVNSVIYSYHYEKFKKDNESQAMGLINYLKDYRVNDKIIGRIWKKYSISNTMFRLTSMILENAFITPFKKAMYCGNLTKGKCVHCKDAYADENHLLSGCKGCTGDYIRRHDIVVDEIYKYIIINELNNRYDCDRKMIKFTKGFLEKGKVIGTIVKDKYLYECGRLKPDIVYKKDKEIFIIEIKVCQPDKMQFWYDEVDRKYKLLQLRLKSIYAAKKATIIPVVYNIYGFIHDLSRKALKECNIKLDENKLFKDILCFEVDLLIRQNRKYNLLLTNTDNNDI